MTGTLHTSTVCHCKTPAVHKYLNSTKYSCTTAHTLGGPKSNRTLNLACELEVVVRCSARCCGSTQYSRVCHVASIYVDRYCCCGFFSKCLLGSSVIFMMADNKEQRVCVKFCFLLGKSATETV